MKASDYIVEYLIEKKISDIFGYPGGMVTHLMDSLSKYKDKITAHLAYNEQGAAMAACGYAQVSGKIGVAYATSGPGATNMITGICNAYMDSIPTLFITGQVNSFEQKGDFRVRQRGFQETDIVSIVSNVTKYAVQINSTKKLKWYLDYAFTIANEGRKGPVLLDIAMDVTRADIIPEQLEGYVSKEKKYRQLSNFEISKISSLIKEKKRPVILIGNGVSKNPNIYFNLLNNLYIPVVSSMIAIDIQSSLDNYYGFIGVYGDRTANFIVSKSDFIITLGARLDVRQVGVKRENFASNAEIVRIDIDDGELEYKLHPDELDICADANIIIPQIINLWNKYDVDYSNWIGICNEISEKLSGIDDKIGNILVKKISEFIPPEAVITTDVGQNQIWIAQSFKLKSGQRVLFSGGHGAMGYSLPAAIGASLGAKSHVYCFNGDGGIQMNIQELQVITRERLPIKIIVFNNNALGMIRHFQEIYFDKNYYQTIPSGGFTTPDFVKIAEAYNLNYIVIDEVSEVETVFSCLDDAPVLIEIRLPEDTYVFPKLEFGKPIQDQEPLIDRNLYNYLMEL